jgi:hypothetical protein
MTRALAQAVLWSAVKLVLEMEVELTPSLFFSFILSVFNNDAAFSTRN